MSSGALDDWMDPQVSSRQHYQLTCLNLRKCRPRRVTSPTLPAAALRSGTTTGPQTPRSPHIVSTAPCAEAEFCEHDLLVSYCLFWGQKSCGSSLLKLGRSQEQGGLQSVVQFDHAFSSSVMTLSYTPGCGFARCDARNNSNAIY